VLQEAGKLNRAGGGGGVEVEAFTLRAPQVFFVTANGLAYELAGYLAPVRYGVDIFLEAKRGQGARAIH
jgi:hypothetical protein